MSRVLEAHADFVRLLLQTPSKTQAVALLDTCTNGQIDALSDIAKNLLHLPLSPSARIVVSKRRNLLNKLSPSSKLSVHQKARLIGKHYRLVLEVLKAVKKPLLQLLKALLKETP